MKDFPLSEATAMADSVELADQSLRETDLYEYEEGDPNSSLGDEPDLDDALDPKGEEDDSDVVDDFLHDVIDMVAVEYEEESAVNAVEDAIKSLVDEASIDDLPGKFDPDDVKVRWIWNSIAKIKLRLKEFGLDFDETDLAFYETYKHMA